MASSAAGMATLGRWFAGLGLLASGAQQVVTGEFVRLVPRSGWLPSHRVLPYATGVVLAAAGLAVLSGRWARTAATAIAAALVVMVFFFYPPAMAANPLIDRPFLRGFNYTNPLKCFALVGGAAILAGTVPGSAGERTGPVAAFGRAARLGPYLLAAFLLVAGVQHFWYARFVATLVPAWIPPGQMFWTYFTGVALMAGGLGMLVPRTARLAAALSALMIFLWVLLLHIPRAVAGPRHAFEAAGIFEALALSGVALLVAAYVSGGGFTDGGAP
jgi:uncharacterized membrane protein